MSVEEPERLAAACVNLIGPPDGYVAPPGYDGLALAIVDAIWSMGVRYQGVGNVLDRYRLWVEDTHAVSAEARTAQELLVDICQAGGAEAFARNVVRNRQLTSTRSGVLKAVAVEQACSALLDCGVNTAADLRERAADDEVKARWLSVHGQRSGISWRYVLMNVQVEDLKPDRMVCRFVARALNLFAVNPTIGHAQVSAAHLVLTKRYPELSLRALDHAIWSYESGRARRSSPIP